MNQIELIRDLFAYDRWATLQMIERAERLTNDQFIEDNDTPFESIRNQRGR
jgi:uncharacterized damage-inducible protein DinB